MEAMHHVVGNRQRWDQHNSPSPRTTQQRGHKRPRSQHLRLLSAPKQGDERKQGDKKQGDESGTAVARGDARVRASLLAPHHVS